MAHFSFYRVFNSISFSIKDDFCEHKKWYLLFIIVLAVGIGFGLIAGINIADDASISKIPDHALRCFLKGDMSIFGVFCTRIISTIILLTIIFVCNIKPLLSFFTFALILYKSFCLGTIAALLVSIFKFGGFVNLIIVILPTQFICLGAMCLFAVICVAHNWQCRGFGGSILCTEFFIRHKFNLILIGILILIAILLELILLPILCNLLIN